jgi:hypothetical protein
MCRNIKTLFNFEPPTVEEVTAAAHRLMQRLVTHAEPRNREVEVAMARARSEERFGHGAGPGTA